MKLLSQIFIILFFNTSLAFAQSAEGEVAPEIAPKYENESSGEKIVDNTPMTLERMAEIVKRLDPNAKFLNDGRAMMLTIAEVEITIISDPRSNRMRAFAPVTSLDGVDSQKLYRMLQANFDSTLDARYSIAKEFVLSAFIHPFAELSRKQFIEGIGQVVNLVKTYGTAYSSGAMTFGGGDSRQLHRKLIDDLLKKGDTI